MKLNLLKKSFASFLSLFLSSTPLSYDAKPVNQVSVKDQYLREWKSVDNMKGNCKACFPTTPHHIEQNMPSHLDNKTIAYDVYVADAQKKSVFMVLVASYPDEIVKDRVVHNLEHFLNTIVNQNPNTRLVFADLVDVNGHQGMDFFLRNDQVYFKGRAVIRGNTFYLMAMECETQNYQDSYYQFFIESFRLN
jgi:hypothetical protein